MTESLYRQYTNVPNINYVNENVSASIVDMIDKRHRLSSPLTTIAPPPSPIPTAPATPAVPTTDITPITPITPTEDTIEDFYGCVTWWMPMIISVVVGGIITLLLATVVRPSHILIAIIVLFLIQGGVAGYVAGEIKKRYNTFINYHRSPNVVSRTNKVFTAISRVQMFMQPGVPIYMWMKLNSPRGTLRDCRLKNEKKFDTVRKYLKI